MDEFSLLREAVEAFREYGFEAELVASPRLFDGQLLLEKGGVRRIFELEVKLPLTLSNIGMRDSVQDVLYVTDHVSARTAEALRRMEISFVDASGNAFLEDGSWYIDVRGRKRATLREAEYARYELSPNLFSAKRAQVVFTLLTWSDLLGESVRRIASASGVSVGIAQSTTNELRRRGMWPDHETARASLIDGWAAAFPDNLARSLTLRTVHAEQFDRFYGPVIASGEAAPSAQIRGTSGVVYVDELSTELLLMNRWRTDGLPNLIVRRRFWSHPYIVENEAPPLLVYGDLQASDDPRVRSVALEYRQRL